MKRKQLTARQLLRLAIDETGLPDYKVASQLRPSILPSDFSRILNDRMNPTDAEKQAIAKRFSTVPVTAWGAKQ